MRVSLAEIEIRRKNIESRIDSLLQEKASLQNKINRANLEIENQELAISTEGGGFASLREEYKEKAKEIEGKIEATKEQIRSLCAELLPFSLIPELCLALKNRLEDEEKEQQRQAALTYLNLAVNDLTKDIGSTLFLDALKLSKEEKQLVANEAIKIMRNRIQKMNGHHGENIHAVSSLERRDLLRWIEVALKRTPSELQELSSCLKSLESESEIIRGYIFNAPSDEMLRPLFLKLGELHQELGKLVQKQASLQTEYESTTAELKLVAAEQDNLLNEKTQFDNCNMRVQLATKAQNVLEEYLQLARAEKINEFKENFLECFNLLIGKQNMVGNADVASANYDITLLTPQGIPISKTELSAGERQIYAMAMIWALAKTSGRPLPFIIDTPLGRLDIDHRNNVLENFLISASHQMIIFSTNTEIDKPYFNQLNRYIAKAYNLEFDLSKGRTIVTDGYFGEKSERC